MEIKTESIQPIGANLLIQPYTDEAVTDKGIELASSTANSFPVLGTILKAGKESTYAIGQQVMFRRYSMDELKMLIGGEEKIVYMLEEADILAIYAEEVSPPATPYQAIRTMKQNKGIIPNEEQHANEEAESGVKEPEG